MTGPIVKACVGSRLLVVIIAAAAVGFGVVQVRGTPVEPLPEVAPVTVEVQSEALGLSAQEVEDLVTVPLEANLLSGVAWVDRMTSSSITGLSSIVMTFEEGTDLVRARQVVQERLTQGALLTNASKVPVMLQPTSSANRVMMVGLSSSDKSLVDLSVLSRWTVRPKLMSVKGVANVAVWGMRDQQLQVHADPERMRQHGVSLDELVASTGNALWVSPLSFLKASTPGRGGFLDLPQQRVNVQHVSPITDSAALGRVAAEGASGPGVALADVATIVEAPPTIIGDGIVADASGLVLVVEKQPMASTAEVSTGIETALAALSQGLPGVTIDSSIYRPADYVADAGRNLALAALVALVLVALGSALVYRAWRPVLTVVTTSSVSLMAGWLVLWLRQEPVNLMALTGLAAGVGLAVAQAVTAISALRRMSGELTVTQRVAGAYGSLGVTAVYTTLAAALLTLPAFLLAGRAGAFLSETAAGYLLATAGSLVVALTVAPALAALIGGHGTGDPSSPGAASAWSRSAGRLASSAPLLVAVIVAGAAASAAIAVRAEVQTRPSFQERTLVLKATVEQGTSPQALTRSLSSLAGTVRTLDGVAGVGGHVGRAVTGDRITGSSSGELWITLAAGADRGEVAGAAMAAARSAGVPDPTVEGYLDGRADVIFPEAAGPMVVSVYGPVPDTLQASAAQALAVVSQTAGVRRARIVGVPTEQDIQITVDIAKAEALGMTPGYVRRQAATLIGGLEVGAIYEQQKVFDVQVWTAENLRNSPEKVRALPIDTPNGAQVPLGHVATVAMTEQPTAIHRESVQRRVDIVADVSGGAARDAVAVGLARMRLPAEYHAEVRDEAANLASNRRDVVLYSVIAVLGVLLLLQAALRNWWTSVAAMAAIPLGMVGGFVATLLVGGLTTGALTGLLALAVLGVHNALAVVRLAQTRADDRDDALRAAVWAVLPATAVTILVGLGVALIGSRAGLEGIGDLALVTAFGALTTGLVAVTVLPAIAVRYGSRVEAIDDLSIEESPIDDAVADEPVELSGHA